MIEAFEGNKAETKTMLPTITSFMAAHQLADVTVVADAGMVSEANREALEDADLSYIIGARIGEEPYRSRSGARTTPAKTSLTVTSSPLPGPRTRSNGPLGVATRSPTTATRPTPRGGPYTGSTPRSPRQNAPWPARNP